MPFKDTTDGQTHSYNDGCGEPAHNDMTTPQSVEETCDHPVLEPVLCRKCKAHLQGHEVEHFGEFIEVAGFCPNEECEMFEILVV